MNIPNFIIGGTSAGGTSFLSAAVVQHPNIYLPKKMRPEPHYYYKSWEFEKGIDYYSTQWFSDVSGQKAIGERSSSYMFGGRNVAERMKRDIPKLKLVFTLRDPVLRAWANYRYTVLQGLEDTDFDSALKNEEQRIAELTGVWSEIQPYNYTGRGFYGQQLVEFLEYFTREDIFLIESEEMSKSPQKIFSNLFTFLGVDSDFKPSLPPLYSSMNVNNPLKQKEMRAFFNDKFDLIIEAIRKDEDPFDIVNSEEEKQKLNLLIKNLTSEKQQMSCWAKQYLHSLYKEDKTLLKDKLGFSPMYWNL